jgi:hypothetical protein
VAAKDAAHSQIESAEGTMLPDGLNGILRAGRSEAARGRRQRRYASLIEIDRQKKELGKQAFHDSFSAMRARSVETFELISAVGTISSEI